VDRAKHHATKGEKGFKIIALPKETNSECFIWQVAFTVYAFKRKNSEEEEKETMCRCGERKGSPAPGTHVWRSRKALALKEYLHSLSKAGWLLAARREKNNYEVNAHKPYCFLRCSHALGNYDSEIQILHIC